MIISISLSIAEVFDRLSILQIKIKNGLNCQEEFRILLRELTESIGQYKFESVMSSKEYINLYDINEDCWKLISNIRKGEKFDAKLVDDANMLRFKFKKELQEKHFQSELLERKEIVNE